MRSGRLFLRWFALPVVLTIGSRTICGRIERSQFFDKLKMKYRIQNSARKILLILLLSGGFAWPSFGDVLTTFAPLPPNFNGSNVGCTDFANLFDDNSPWQNASRQIQAFKLYAAWLYPSFTSDAELAREINFINNHGLLLTIEAPALPAGQGCGDNVEGFGTTWVAYLNRVKAAGGDVRYIQMDEPYYYGGLYTGPNACQWTPTYIAQQVQVFTNSVKTVFPNAIVGDAEPIGPGIASAGDMNTWLSTYRFVTGAPMPFLIEDSQKEPGWENTALKLETISHQNGAQFGIIYIGLGGDITDQAWMDNAEQMMRAYQIQAGGKPDLVNFQSWTPHPRLCLPESDSSKMTSMIDYYFANIRPPPVNPPPVNGAEFVSQKVPATMTTGQTYSVQIVMKNTGTTSWTNTGTTPFKLGSQNPQDNFTWGTGRVALAPGETIAPEASRTFTFNVTAPATPGTYNFQWQMLQETVAWFGDTTHNVSITVQPRHAAGDYDGDGKSDPSVYRPSNGTWYILPSGSPGTSTQGAFGLSTDIPVPGDYNGDGKNDVAVWRPTDGTWYIQNIANTAWGTAGDIPVPGDYDGDGKTDLAVFRPSEGKWYILTSGSNYTNSIVKAWGASTDIPVPGDYDGDGKTDLAVFRPSNGTWWVLSAASNYTAPPPSITNPINWGTTGDIPVVNSVTTVIQAMGLVPPVQMSTQTVTSHDVTVTPVSVDLSGIRVYPNPWRSDQDSNQPYITFDTLPAGSTIKIFTVSGHLVQTLTPSGTSITWPLTNSSGDKVASGVYVYLITNQGQKKTGQILVIK